MRRWFAKKLSRLFFCVSIIWFFICALYIVIKALASLAWDIMEVMDIMESFYHYFPYVWVNKALYVILKLMYNNVTFIIVAGLMMCLGIFILRLSRKINPDRAFAIIEGKEGKRMKPANARILGIVLMGFAILILNNLVIAQREYFSIFLVAILGDLAWHFLKYGNIKCSVTTRIKELIITDVKARKRREPIPPNSPIKRFARICFIPGAIVGVIIQYISIINSRPRIPFPISGGGRFLSSDERMEIVFGFVLGGIIGSYVGSLFGRAKDSSTSKNETGLIETIQPKDVGEEEDFVESIRPKDEAELDEQLKRSTSEYFNIRILKKLVFPNQAVNILEKEGFTTEDAKKMITSLPSTCSKNVLKEEVRNLASQLMKGFEVEIIPR